MFLFAERHPECGSALIPHGRNLQTFLIPRSRLHSLLALAITHPPCPIALMIGFGHYSSSIAATAVSGSSPLAHPEFSQCRSGGAQGAQGTAIAVSCSSSLAHPAGSQRRSGGVQGAQSTATAVAGSFWIICWRFPHKRSCSMSLMSLPIEAFPLSRFRIPDKR